VHLETGGGPEKQVVSINKGSASFSFRSPNRPERLVADPEIHVFRQLTPQEIPASVNSVKGSRDLVAVLAASADSGYESTFAMLLESLNQGRIPVRKEDQVNPSDIRGRDVIFFGRPRPATLRWLLPSEPNGIRLLADGFSYDGAAGEGSGDCLFAVFKDPDRKGKLSAIFYPVEGTAAESVDTAARKITHYGKFSAVSFADGTNCSKNIWAVTQSPLIVTFEEPR
jgi:hypothetical protein